MSEQTQQRPTETAFALDDIGDKLGDVYLTLDGLICRMHRARTAGQRPLTVEDLAALESDLYEARETINALITAAESA